MAQIISFFEKSMSRPSEGVFRRDFFKAISTRRDTLIAHVFDDFKPPGTPHTPTDPYYLFAEHGEFHNPGFKM